VDIVFDTGDQVFSRESSPLGNALSLRAIMDCLVALNLAFLEEHSTTPLYSSGVYYQTPPVALDKFMTIPVLYGLGYGDCKSLTAARIAELQKQGIACEPAFRWHENPATGPDFHILLLKANGWEDPSKRLGMPDTELASYYSSTELTDLNTKNPSLYSLAQGAVRGMRLTG